MKKNRVNSITFLLLCGAVCGILCGLFAGMLSAPSSKVSAETFFAYAYSKSGDRFNVSSADELVTAAASSPVTISGTINISKYVLVENGTPRITEKSEFKSGNPTIYIYIPDITVNEKIAEDGIANTLVRLVDSPITDWVIRANEPISKGRFRGVTLSFYPSNADASAVASSAPVKIQIYDGTSWRDVWTPENSNYNITEENEGGADPDISKCRGLTATVENCSINGITNQMLHDWTGMVITVNGAGFTRNVSGRWHDVTKWFTNIPLNCKAMVRYNIEPGSSKIRIVLARRGPSGTFLSTPYSSSTDPIKIVIPLGDLIGPNGDIPWANIDGGVVVTVNSKATYNIIDSSDFSGMTKPMAVSQLYEGVFDKVSDGGSEKYLPVGKGDEYSTVYIPSALMEQLPAGEGSSNGGKLIQFVLEPEESGVFIYDNSDTITLNGDYLSEVCEGVYSVRIALNLSKLVAKKVTSGEFTVKMRTKSGYITLDKIHTHLRYEIVDQEHAVENNDDDETGGEGGEENYEDDGGDDLPPSGEAPDIWVNGKDNKKAEIYKKSFTMDVSRLLGSIPDDCKLVISVTAATVDDASGAFSSGKGKKSNIAKAAYKKADNTIVVTAGKSEGSARIWIAAVDKKKKIQDSGYFDVLVGTAPKKLFIATLKSTNTETSIKSVALNAGEKIRLYVNDKGSELSAHSEFTWTVSNDNDCLQVTPSANTQSALIKVVAAPSGNKVQKASVTVVNTETGKKVKFNVQIGNEVKDIDGLSDELETESAAEAAVEQELAYTLVCADGGNQTTDKIKVYTTSALEEGKGYSNNGRKFTLSSKSKIKVTYKNGSFSLKVPKKTKDGTQVRVLVVVTHADKSIDVFESGVITTGETGGK